LCSTLHTHLDQHLSLLPQKAVYWHEEQSLLLADLHLGKAAHFRKAGIPVPSLVHHHDLQRLDELLLMTQAKKIYFLGDLFHSALNREWYDFTAWMEKYPEKDFILIKGNHDILPDQVYEESRLQIISEKLAIPPFLLTHEPLKEKNKKSDLYPICGHVHPAVSLRGSGFQQITLPCFYFGLHYALLPAFGKFTGFHKIKPGKRETVYAITENRVLHL
jgi:DNA ligase-associated metallophosphoesterase